MLNQRLSQKQIQKLSPQQIQLMKLLQIPTATLEQRIKEELEANPALDEGVSEEPLSEVDQVLKELENGTKESTEETNKEDDFDLSDYISDDEGDIAGYKLKSNNYSADDEQKSIPTPVVNTFHEYLETQIGHLKLNEEEEIIAYQIVGSIDEDGYLRRDLESICDDLAFGQNVSADETQIEAILEKIQKFDPPGVGARTLQECLLNQLYKKDKTVYINLAIEVLEKHFETFTKKHYEKLLRSLGIEADLLKKGIDEILKLNPKPGGSHQTSSCMHHHVVPDYILSNQGGELSLTLNARNAPELRISNNFKEMMHTYKESKEKSRQQKEAILFIKQKIDSAKWFIDAIRQRQETMLNTMQAILNHQYEYFLTGDEKTLKPMILKDIAEVTHLDISTVSRVANSKYIQTEFGTFLLKSFFSESLQTKNGEEVSTREVKKILEEIVAGEDKKKPYSDQKLAELLQEKGYNIARRTVAKYKEQLGIPVARLRKQL